jgi:hypothetical protein
LTKDVADLLLVPRINVVETGLRDKIVSYLQFGTTVTNSLRYSDDMIGGRFVVAGGESSRTDGHYYWRADASAYILEYGIEIPVEAIDHMRAHNWVAPAVGRAAFVGIGAYLEQQRRLTPEPRRFSGTPVAPTR